MGLHVYVHFVDNKIPSDELILAIRNLLSSAISGLKGELMEGLDEVKAGIKAIQDSEADEASTVSVLGGAVTTLIQTVADLKKALEDAAAGSTIPQDVKDSLVAAAAASAANVQSVKDVVASIQAA